MEYRVLEFLSYSLELLIHLQGSTAPMRMLIAKDQRRLIKRNNRIMACEIMDAIAEEGDHNGFANWKRLVWLLEAKEWQKALDLLPVLGLWPAGPFIDECPALERFDGRSIERERRARD